MQIVYSRIPIGSVLAGQVLDQKQIRRTCALLWFSIIQRLLDFMPELGPRFESVPGILLLSRLFLLSFHPDQENLRSSEGLMEDNTAATTQ